MEGFISILLLIISTFFFTYSSRPVGSVDFLVSFSGLMTVQVILAANVLSLFNLLANTTAWVGTGILFLILSGVAIFYQNSWKRVEWKALFHFHWPFDSHWFRTCTLFEKLIFIPLILTLFFTALVNLFLIINLAPGNFDSMTSHLARVGYYLQHGNYQFFEANYWGQVVHPRNSTSLFLYAMLTVGSENAAQFVQYVAYWVSLITVYGITNLAGLKRNQALFSALIAGLLISILMQATTTQNDLLLTAYTGSVIYWFLLFRIDHKRRHLVMASIAIAIALGIKASIVLAMIPAALVAIYSLSAGPAHQRLQNYLFTAGSVIIALIFFTLTSGYLNNIQKFGHPLGPENIRIAHTFESESPDYIVKNGIRNSMRYAVEFVSLDGLPTITPVRKIQKRIRGYSQDTFDRDVILPQREQSDHEEMVEEVQEPPLIRYQGSNRFIHYLMDQEAVRAQFNYFKMPTSHEDRSYWGVFGFALLWMTLLYSLFAKSVPKTFKVLAISAIVFFLLQAFSGPYDPWRGRYFNIAIIFVLPSAGYIMLTKQMVLKGYLLFIILVGSVSAISGVILKSGSFYPATEDDGSEMVGSYRFLFHFNEDRIAELTRKGPYYEVLKRFDNVVPKNAAVAVFLHGDSYEYPLFGKNRSRKLYPINSFINGRQPIPEEAEYLLYVFDYPDADPENDILLGDVLGNRWYLRPL